MFVFGLAVFALASLLVGLSPAGWWLITARAVQGVGAAIVAPSYEFRGEVPDHLPGGSLMAGRACQNGLTETELKEMIVHLAFYAAGRARCPRSPSARELFDGGDGQ